MIRDTVPMANHVLQLFLIAVLVARGVPAPEANYTGSYLIIAPNTIRPNLPYTAVVNILKSKEPVVVRLHVLSPENRTVAQGWGQDIRTGVPSTISIDKVPSDLRNGVYRLYAKGETVTGEILFETSQEIQCQNKFLSVFIQTDKSIYKPGSNVHIRAAVVKPDLKPFDGEADVTITDPNQNVLKQFLGLKLQEGVIGLNDSLNLQLSSEPLLGDWLITVKVGNQKETQLFTVEKYVLPKFEVKVVPPSYSTINSDIAVLVSAKYTYGKGVRGTATITAKYPWPYFGDNDIKAIEQTKTLGDSGEVFFHLSNKALRSHGLLNDYGYNQIKFIATVKEELTDLVRNGTAEVTIYKHPAKVVITKLSDLFSPGLNYSFLVGVQQQDSTPISDTMSRSVFVTVDFNNPYPPIRDIFDVELIDSNTTQTTMPRILNPKIKEYSFNVTLDERGFARLTVKAPADASSMRIEARYGSVNSDVYHYEYVTPFISPTKSFLVISYTEGEINAGDSFQFTVESTADVKTIYAQMTSRGYIAWSGKAECIDRVAQFSSKITNEMAPSAKLVVYAIRPDNKEIVAASQDIKVSGMFENKVEISVDPKRAEPNTKATFTVQAAPASIVGLLAVDQSVLLLKSGNDITMDEVENEIASYSTGQFAIWRDNIVERRRKRMVFCYDCSGKDAHSIFQSAGLVILTDAYLYRELFYRRYAGPMAMKSSPLTTEAKVFETEAVPMIDDDAPKSGAGAGGAAPRLRVHFPETWLWTDFKTSANGKAEYTAVVPDTITSWIASAFAINKKEGLGVSLATAKLEVFRPFFLRLNLPYSVKRGESMALQVLVFNYMDSQQTVVLTLEHNDNSGFEFVQKASKKSLKDKTPLNIKTINVAGKGGSAAVYFPIRPTKIGTVNLKVKAQASFAADAVQMPLIVEAEGYPVYSNTPVIIDLRVKKSYKFKSSLQILGNVIEGSEKAEVSVIGDIMGPIFNNIDSLIKMPYGCGEQNMINFVPDIVVMQYLNFTKRLTSEVRSKLLKYLEAGYQRELNYQREDSSYSVFGKTDPQGSTWLTAFVVRSFKQAAPYVHVDTEKLKASIRYLLRQQKENGAFEESGEVHSIGLQGGSSQSGVPLTAFVMMALLENKVENPEGLNYLEHSLQYISNDSYALAIANYVLHLANSSKRDTAFRMLERIATEKEGMKYWPACISEASCSWMINGSIMAVKHPSDIEATAYALMTYVLRGDSASAFPIVRYLVSQQNAHGGFASTQDTVVALMAFAAYAAKTFSSDIDMKIAVRNGDRKTNFNLTPANAIILQSAELDSLDQPIELEALGRGVAFAQLSWHYNVKNSDEQKPFVCEQRVYQKSSNEVLLALCCNYNLAGRSNMAVVELDAPSGFAIDAEKLQQLTADNVLQRVETEKGNTHANLYFKSFGHEVVCFNVSSSLVYQVADQKPALVTLYDYYEPAHRIEFGYSASKKLKLEDVCGEACWLNVKASAPVEELSRQEGSRAQSSGRLCFWLLFCILLSTTFAFLSL